MYIILQLYSVKTYEIITENINTLKSVHLSLKKSKIISTRHTN